MMNRPSASSEERAPPEHLLESTRSLLERAQTGDGEALDEICARYLPRLTTWAAGRLPLRARGLVDTCDLAQETLIRVLHRLDSLKTSHPTMLPAYLRTAILNRIRDEIRRAAARPEYRSLTGNEVDPSPSPLERAIGRDLADRYETALAQLNDTDRSVVFLRFEMGMTYREIAETLDLPSKEAARKAVHRALHRFTQVLES